MSIQENINKVEELTSIINKHLVGGKLSFDSNHILYILNENYSGFGGVRVSLDKGKINALVILIRKLDELYNIEFGWSSHHVELQSI